MPALNEADYSKFSRMLDELEGEIPSMKEAPKSFMSDMVAKRDEFGERMFVSPKQYQWVIRLHEEYVGDTDHEAEQTEAPDLQDPRFSDDSPEY